ncbi:MAG TPA: radical SAM protein [Geothrix sp.]|nr:radical SAM protein [Geothrix sp.]
MEPYERLVIEVTEACHHACSHCYNPWRQQRAPVGSPETLTRREIRQLVRKVRRDAPIKVVAVSGGEPLLRTDTPEIVGDLVDDGLAVVVITNGTLLVDEAVSRFPEGTVFEVTLFSTDGRLHDAIAGRPGAFRNVIAGAACLRRHRCRLAVAVVVNRLNAEDVRPTLELGIALGADSLLLNRVNLSRATLPGAARLAPDPDQLRFALAAADEVAAEYQATVAVSVPVPPCLVDPGPYRHLHFGWCPRGGKDAYYTLGYNGLLRPCNHASVVLGDLRTQGFAEIVGSAASEAFWEPAPSACRACPHPLAEACRGGCPAASWECYGTGERWDPIIDVAAGRKPGSEH